MNEDNTKNPEKETEINNSFIDKNKGSTKDIDMATEDFIKELNRIREEEQLADTDDIQENPAMTDNDIQELSGQEEKAKTEDAAEMLTGGQETSIEETPYKFYESETHEESKPSAKDKKSFADNFLIPCIAVSLCAGLFGGYVSAKVASPGNTVIYKAAETSEEEQTSKIDDTELSAKEIAAKAAASVVEINVTSTEESVFGQYQVQGAGSGIIHARLGCGPGS